MCARKPRIGVTQRHNFTPTSNRALSTFHQSTCNYSSSAILLLSFFLAFLAVFSHMIFSSTPNVYALTPSSWSCGRTPVVIVVTKSPVRGYCSHLSAEERLISNCTPRFHQRTDAKPSDACDCFIDWIPNSFFASAYVWKGLWCCLRLMLRVMRGIKIIPRYCLQ